MYGLILALFLLDLLTLRFNLHLSGKGFLVKLGTTYRHC